MNEPSAGAQIRNTARFTFLCVSLTALLLLSPILSRGPTAAFSLRMVFTLVLLASAYAVSRRRWVLWLSLVIISPLITFEWLLFQGVVPDITVPLLIIQGCFLAFVVSIILQEIVREKDVSVDTVIGGISVYLLIAIAYSLAYAVLERLAPGSFLVDGSHFSEIDGPEARNPVLLYYSLVTITTLGYGDVTPVTAGARMLSATEAVVGQLYVAIFVASLVGLYLARDRSPT